MGSASLSKPSSSQVTQTTAVSTYSASGFYLPQGSSNDFHVVSYSNIAYNWSFSDGTSATGSSGTKIFSNLKIGQINTITATVIVSCTETDATRSYIEDGYWKDTGETDENGKPIQEWVDTSYWSEWYYQYNTYNFDSAFASVPDVCTQPLAFSLYNFEKHTRIQDNLTIEVVTAWCEQCGKYLSWLNQTSQYDAANHLIPNSKDVITADWYNACSKLCGLNTIVIKDKTRITAKLFKDLGEKVSPTKEE